MSPARTSEEEGQPLSEDQIALLYGLSHGTGWDVIGSNDKDAKNDREKNSRRNCANKPRAATAPWLGRNVFPEMLCHV